MKNVLKTHSLDYYKQLLVTQGRGQKCAKISIYISIYLSIYRSIYLSIYFLIYLLILKIREGYTFQRNLSRVFLHKIISVVIYQRYTDLSPLTVQCIIRTLIFVIQTSTGCSRIGGLVNFDNCFPVLFRKNYLVFKDIFCIIERYNSTQYIYTWPPSPCTS